MTDNRPAGQAGRVAARPEPWLAVVVLMLVGLLNYLDRILPGMLAEPIRRDLALSDTALGLINGAGFLLVYAVAGIPVSRLADRGRYTAVIAGSLALWSAMTALGSVARSGLAFGATRLGVAVGEAGCTPSSQAFVSRHFAPERRGRALSLVALGSPIGLLAGMMGGGYLAGAFGWRLTCLMMGAAGLVFAPVVALVLRAAGPGSVTDPEDGAAARAVPGHWYDLFRTRTGVLLVLAGSFIAIGGYSSNAFTAAFLMRVHGMTIADAGIRLGIGTGVFGVSAIVLTGWLADRLSAAGDPRWIIRVAAGITGLTVPAWLAGYTVADTNLAVACLAVGAGGMNCYVPLTVLALYRLVEPEVRARTSATLLFCTAVLGGLGPLVIGLISDSLAARHAEQALGIAMLVVPAVFTLSTLCYLAAGRTFAGDLQRRGEPDGLAAVPDFA
ncbi:MFS transporter [Novosphingobium bradum]|uniref:MFS transporter n=1 Tax=Novosphingobium bradum TaxID=1737444 RepID=A0ABV7IJ73_9SPHN